MISKVSISSIFHCSLERAFKTPMLCDVSKIHTGMAGVMPRITHAENDQDWGKPGAKKDIFAARSLTFKGGKASTDRVIERIENSYWKIEVTDFTAWMLGFYRFVGEWKTTEIKPNHIHIHYTYTLYSNVWLLQPINWLFTKIFWRIYMKQVLENVRKLVNTNEPYLYP